MPNFAFKKKMGAMDVAVRDSQPAVSEADIANLERLTGIKLSADYRAFLLASNGGVPEADGFSTRDHKVDSFVSQFPPISGDVEDNLLDEIKGITLARQISQNLIPIASTPAGNRVVLSVAGKDVGSVYYWAWDEEPEEASCSYEYMRIVADSFSDFISSLRRT